MRFLSYLGLPVTIVLTLVIGVVLLGNNSEHELVEELVKDQNHVEMETGHTKPAPEARPSVEQSTAVEIAKDSSDTLEEPSTEARPPLSSLVNANGKIIGDVQFLLDFAIVGHPKCATSTLMRWMNNHESVSMYNHEIHALKNGHPDELVELLYRLPEGEYKRGYKAPNDIHYPHTVQSLHQFFPRTKLIVGLRHPVKWFESFYNYKTRQGGNLPPPDEMVGWNLPTQVFFHNHLAQLGKTSPISSQEMKLLNTFQRFDDRFPYMENEVFLYDVSQPFDQNETRNEIFRTDLQHFIGLSEPFEKLVPRSSPSSNFHFAIDICDGHDQLRADLLQVGRAAAAWIRDFFLPREDVKISSPEHFVSILDTWSTDPCGDAVINRRPPLSSLIQNDEIVGDVSSVIDFGIVGHAKCATTTLMKWLADHEEISMKKKEMHQLTFGHPAGFVKGMYELPDGDYIRGYKAPNDSSNQLPRDMIREYFPSAKLIIGLRHPVSWFGSWYNFKERQGFDLGPPEDLVGNLPFQVLFAQHLAMMGKTALDSTEIDLLGHYLDEEPRPPPLMRNKVFLYDVSQPFDQNSTRNYMFRKDLGNFLGLTKELVPLIPRESSRNADYAMDICDDKLKELRGQLLELGKNGSIWIREYFLPHENVIVSSIDHLHAVLQTWDRDPCDGKEGGRL